MRRAIAFSAAWAALATGLSCSTPNERQGALVLALQTDMSIPKDVDRVGVEISSRGKVQFAQEYDVGKGGLKIPATLTIQPGKDPSEPITVRVYSRLLGRVRTLREVVTTVPDDRVAQLRVPIQWLCDGSGKQVDGKVVSTCEKGTTCISGHCVGRALDSANLPLYEAKQVFGGADAPGATGQCFDTAGCFAHGVAADVDPRDCTAPIPSEPGEGLNVALVNPLGGAGICGISACLVPLDAQSPLGWEKKNGRIALPKAVCSMIEQGRILAVATTGSCKPKTPATPTCGVWSSVTSERGTDAAPPPENVLLEAGAELDAAEGGDAGDASCSSSRRPLVSLPVAALLAVDASASLAGATWDAIRGDIVAAAKHEDIAGSALAASFFPPLGGADCETGAAFDVPALPFTVMPGGADALTNAFAARSPTGSVALEGALRGLGTTATAFAKTTRTHRTIGILVSAAPPDACDTKKDSLAEIAKGIATDADAPVDVHVIALDGADRALLDVVAAAGGTGSASKKPLGEGLREIVAGAAPCAYRADFDLSSAVLRVDGGEPLSRVESASDCAGAPGWFEARGAIELCPESCASGAKATVEVCPVRSGEDASP